MLKNKIDFVLTVSVENANPNGDPLNGNLPRTDYESHGEISDVAIKRKIRNRMQDMGKNIFVKAKERADDGHKSLETRFEAKFEEKSKDDEDFVYEESCKSWLDVRSFGQVITYQSRSIGIRGPVSISLAKSVEPVNIITMQITRSANSMKADEGKERSSDTMGSKSYVDYGVYVIKGSINPYFAENTGFTNEDAEVIKNALLTLFENDASSARPEGSMVVHELFWFVHPSKLGVVPTAKIHNLVNYDIAETRAKEYKDYNFRLDEEKLTLLRDKGLEVQVIAV